MKSKIYVSVIILFLLGLLIIYKLNSKDNINEVDENLYNIKYKIKDEYACITFYDDKKYFMYDCDSEPTNYYFDSENDCSYHYNKVSSLMEFNCNSSFYGKDNFTLKVLKWNKDVFEIQYEDEILKFESVS